MGRRIGKSDYTGNRTRFIWDLFCLTKDVSDSSHCRYVYYPESFVPLCLFHQNTVFFYHNDHLGTPRELTDETGAIVWSARYVTFGYCHADPGSTIEIEF